MMGKGYIAYSEYKTRKEIPVSRIPIDWTFKALKWELSAKSGTNTKSETGKFPLWGANGVIGKSDSCISISKCTLVGRVGSAGEVNYAEGQFGVSDNALIIKNHMDDLPRFNFYLLKSLNLEDMVSKNAQPLITASNILNQIIGLPSCFSERNQIANFLDHETAKIDTLIEKQQQLIKLLKEKRQAVISHAVTKGLNPDAPMKDSCVEWLGEVPDHWVVSKFGYISQVVRGGSPRPAGDPTLFNGDYSPWVTVAEITKDDEVYLTETETFLTKKGSEQCRVFKSGTLLLSNSGATLGVPSILSIDANANDGVVGFENLKLNHEYAYHYLSTLTDDLRERIKQGSGQPNLNTDIVKEIMVPLPPSDEIEEIVKNIHNNIETFKKLKAKASIGITLLRERRTALISAAVTGKIDVRNWKPESGEETTSEPSISEIQPAQANAS